MKYIALALHLVAFGMASSRLQLYTGQTQVSRWESAKIRPERLREVDGIVDRIAANYGRYESVARETGVPPWSIAGLHNMECSGSFNLHLHEGSSLNGRTRWVPKGRPTWGKPPFKWEESAKDALFYDNMHKVDWAHLEAALWACESYNGTGYARYHPDTPTPYLWSGTTAYFRGKYTGDGKWSSTAISKQIGIAAIWKRMEDRGLARLTK